MYKWKDRKRKGEKTANFWCSTIECFQVFDGLLAFWQQVGRDHGVFLDVWQVAIGD